MSVMDMSLRLHEYLFYLAGAFISLLGIVHFFMPVLFDFKKAIVSENEDLKPFRLFFYSYATKRSDVYGIAWVMNYAVSYVLVTIGLLDLYVLTWPGFEFSLIVFYWIAGW